MMIASVCCRFQLFDSFVAANICLLESFRLNQIKIGIIVRIHANRDDRRTLMGSTSMKSNNLIERITRIPQNKEIIGEIIHKLESICLKVFPSLFDFRWMV